MAILGQAINDLIVPKPHEPPILTEAEGLRWYLRHCSGETLAWLGGTTLTLILGAFLLGFTLGRIAFFQEMHRLIKEDKTVPPSQAQPKETPTTPTRNNINDTKTIVPSKSEEKKDDKPQPSALPDTPTTEAKKIE